MDEIIAWLLNLIDFHTAADGDDAKACADFIRQVLSVHGVKSQIFSTPGGPRKAYHLLAEVPGRSPDVVMLHAHLDTAGYGEEKDWLFPAGRGTRRRGCVCGRGAIDCKGPLAVWMKLLSDAAEGPSLPYSLRLLVSDLEESGGEYGLGRLLEQHPELLSGLRLVIGEGGGYPFPFREDLFYTFQTGERDPDEEPSCSAVEPAWEQISAVLAMGIKKGYYSADVLAYAAQVPFLSGRRLDIRPLYDGMESFFRKAPVSHVYDRYGKLFEAALQEALPCARLMPYITPGCSDNRWFRKAGVPVIGFFPLDIRNSLSGIHGSSEYVSEMSLALAYRVMSRLLESLSGISFRQIM